MRKRGLVAILLIAFMLMVQLPVTTQAAAGSKQEEYSNLVIFAQFADTQENFMSDSGQVSNIVRNYTDESFPKSLVSYVETISYGQMHINSYLPQYDAGNHSITPVVLPNNREYYATQASDYLAARDALNAFTAANDLSQLNLDQNNDGFIDNVTFIFEGEEGARASVFYPHKEDMAGDNLKINNLTVNTINVLNSESLLDNTSINSYGVIAHEFLHSLGYPDLYTEDGNAEPVGRWDLMASSSNFMQYPLAYLRSSVSGWLNIDEVTTASHLTLSPASSSTGNEAYILRSPLSTSEFFVIEYRKQGTQYSNELDVKIPGTGMIIYRINTKAQDLSNHYGLPFGVYVCRPGETSINGASASNLNNSFFSKQAGRTTFGSTDLNATIADNALVFSDGTNSGIKITNIGEAGDTISCDISFADYASANVWKTIADTNALGSDDSSVASMDVDSSGNPFVLYSHNNRLGVKKYNGTTWNAIGTEGFITGYCDFGQLVIYENVPYVICRKADSQSPNGLAVVLYTYANGQWKQVSSWRPTGTNDISDCCMQVGADGLYLSYLEGNFNSGYTLKLLRCNSANQITEIASNTVTGSYANVDMSCDGNQIYMSARNYISNKPCVLKYDNGKISTILNGEIDGNSAPQIAAEAGKVYLLSDSTSGAMVYQYSDSTGWTKMPYFKGTNGAITDIQSSSSDLAVVNGAPIVQLLNQGADSDNGKNTTQVWRYRSDDWQQEGNNIDAGLSNDTQLAIYHNVVYVTYLSEVGEYNSYTMVKAKEIQLTGQEAPTNVLVSGIKLNATNATLTNKGTKKQLTTVISPTTATNKTLKWSSSNTKVATVSQSGLVTAVASGTTTITVASTDGNAKATCAITVSANKYTIRFNGNGNTNTTTKMADIKNCNYSQAYKLPAVTFTKKGYSFKGWTTKSDGSGTVYANKASVSKLTTTNNKVVTLYAKWSKKTYTLTYNLNSGKNSSKNPATYTISTKTITLSNPSRKGYSFKGWYSDSKYKNQVKTINKGSTGNKTLYAKWAKNTYKITYNLNKGKNSSKNPATYNVTTKTITLANPSRKGYSFKGWYSDSKYKNRVKTINKGSTGHKTLYARWKKK